MSEDTISEDSDDYTDDSDDYSNSSYVSLSKEVIQKCERAVKSDDISGTESLIGEFPALIHERCFSNPNYGIMVRIILAKQNFIL